MFMLGIVLIGQKSCRTKVPRWFRIFTPNFAQDLASKLPELSGVIHANRFARFARIGWFARIGNASDSGKSAGRARKNRGFNCEWFARIDLRESRCESPVPLLVPEFSRSCALFLGKRRPPKIHQILRAGCHCKIHMQIRSKNPQEFSGEQARLKSSECELNISALHALLELLRCSVFFRLHVLSPWQQGTSFPHKHAIPFDLIQTPLLGA